MKHWIWAAAVAGLGLATTAYAGSDTSRPVPPLKPAMAAPDPALCANKATRDAYLETLDGGDTPTLAYYRKVAAHSEALMEWKINRLASRAKWTPEQKARFAMGMLDDPAFLAAFEASMKQVEGMMSMLERMLATKDEAQQCRIALEMTSALGPVSDAAGRQWAAIDAVVDAEAKRLGISLLD